MIKVQYMFVLNKSKVTSLGNITITAAAIVLLKQDKNKK